MLLVVGGLSAFLLAGASGGALTASLMGVALLALAVLSDSLVPNVQQKLLTTSHRTDSNPRLAQPRTASTP